jgi:peptidyl-prolyl cis-trans isomerase SurA
MTGRNLIRLGSLILVAGMVCPTLQGAKIVERIIARVNSEIITQSSYEKEKQRLREQLSENYAGADLETQLNEQSKDVLRDMIDQSLLVQKAKDLEINVDTDVVKELDGYRKKNNLASLEDLESEIEKSGVNYEDFKESIQRNLLVQEVLSREVGSRILSSREDALKYYEAHKHEFKSPGMVRLGQILISNEKHKPDEVEKRAKTALAQLKAGQRFSDVAKKYSDGPSAEQGGDVGFMKESTMASEIAPVVAKLDVNEFSNPIKTKYGYLILKLMERYSAGIPKFEEVEPKVEEVLYQQKMQPQMRAYLKQLRTDSYIYLAPGAVDTGAELPGAVGTPNTGQ